MLGDGTVHAFGREQSLLMHHGVAHSVLWNSWDDAVRICTVDTNRELCLIQVAITSILHSNRCTVQASEVSAVVASPDGQMLAVGHRSGAVSFYEIQWDRKACTATLKRTGYAHYSAVTGLHLCPGFSVLVCWTVCSSANPGLLGELQRRQIRCSLGYQFVRVCPRP